MKQFKQNLKSTFIGCFGADFSRFYLYYYQSNTRSLQNPIKNVIKSPT